MSWGAFCRCQIAALVDVVVDMTSTPAAAEQQLKLAGPHWFQRVDTSLAAPVIITPSGTETGTRKTYLHDQQPVLVTFADRRVTVFRNLPGICYLVAWPAFCTCDQAGPCQPLPRITRP